MGVCWCRWSAFFEVSPLLATLAHEIAVSPLLATLSSRPPGGGKRVLRSTGPDRRMGTNTGGD
jgi:hypothetical protein